MCVRERERIEIEGWRERGREREGGERGRERERIEREGWRERGR